MQTDEAEHLAVENDGDDEQRARAQTRRKQVNFRVESGRGSVIKANRLREIEARGELFEVNRNRCSKRRGHVCRSAPLVADTQFAGLRELQHVAPIHVHHPPQLGDDGAQEFVEVDFGVNVGREPIDDRLAGFVHLTFRSSESDCTARVHVVVRQTR